MAKLTREIQKIFATDAQSTQVTAFRTAGDVPTYTKDVSLIQNSNFTNGWLDADNAGNVIPYAEDMNGLFYTLSRNIAYINQAGIPEWSNAETYYENAMCMYSGVLYISLQDNNSNRQPDTQTSYWTPYASPVSGSVTGGANLGTGEGIYASTISGTINFKSLVAGSNITLTPSVDGTSVTIDASNGGAITSVSWGDIQGSIANQSDLANALSQRGSLSGTNTWTNTNTFSAIILGSNDLATTLSNKQNVISAGNPLSASYISGLASVATSGNYNDLLNQPSIPTVYDATLTIQKNGTTVGTFTANASSDVSLNITETIQSVSSPLSITSNALSISQASSTASGYLSSTDWTTFNSKLSSTIFSDNNTWTGTNTFSGLNVNGNIITNANDTYSIGDTTNRFNLYAQALNAYGSSYFVNLYPSSNNTYKLGNENAYWAQLYARKIYTGAGSGIYLSTGDTASYVKDVTGNTVEVHATASINFKVEDSTRVRCGTSTLRPDANNGYDLGDTSHYWKALYTKNIYFDSVQIYHVGTDNKSLQVMWQNGNTNVAVYMQNATFRPYSNNVLDLGDSNNRWRTIYSVNNLNTSDRRVKNNIENLENGLEKINSIAVKSYTINDHNEGVMYGFIAQDELERNPELVVVPDDYSEEEGGGELCYMPNNVLFLAVKAIQELSEKVSVLENKLKEK